MNREVPAISPAQQLMQQRQRLSLHAQQTVGIVLDHDDLELEGQVHQCFALGEGHREPHGVVERRQHIEKAGTRALLERTAHLIEVEPMGGPRHGDHLGAKADQ